MKSELRKGLLEQRRSLAREQVEEYSQLIRKRLEDLPEYRRAESVGYYYSFDNEADTKDIISGALGKKRVFLPRTEDDISFHEIKSLDGLEKGRFGLMQPPAGTKEGRLDMIIVPGIGFDASGNRLGRGKGYYDRYLAMTDALKIGLAYDFQIADRIPSEDNDIPVDIIITESRVVRCRIIDGKAVAARITDKISNEIASLGKKPGLAVVLVGDDPGSQTYVSIKRKKCAELGIVSKAYDLPSSSTDRDVREQIRRLNNDADVHGILLQLPLPRHLDQASLLEEISPEKDVDCLTAANLGRFYSGNPGLAPCTPKGIIRLLDEYDVKIEGKHAVVVGRSNIVGKPCAALLLQRSATVTACHSKTEDLGSHTRQADILVVACGVPMLVKADMVKAGAVVIDVGTNKIEGKQCGDVDFREVKKIVKLITPVPGGVGPMTVAMLMENTLLCYRRIEGHDTEGQSARGRDE